MITKLNAERFETKLAIQLLKLGIMIDQNFKVPGTNHYLDLYITSPIRGIVEVQYSHKIQSLNSRKLIQSMEQLSDIFGSSVSFFLVMHYKRPIEPLITVIEQFQKKNPNAMPVNIFTIPSTEISPSVETRARQTAEFIRNTIIHQYRAKYGGRVTNYLLQFSDVLHLNVKQPTMEEWFDTLLNGGKTILYRKPSKTLRKRLAKQYDFIKFVNGYGNDRPSLTFVYKGFEIVKSSEDMIIGNSKERVEKGDYIINLGSFLQVKNIEKLDMYGSQYHSFIKRWKAQPTAIPLGALGKVIPIDQGMEDKETIASGKIEGTGVLGGVLVSFRSVINKHESDILEKEIRELYAEYNCNHFTSVALRVGRTLEFIVYVLARAWNVKVNEVTMKLIDQLRSSFNVMINKLIDYVVDEKSDNKKIQKAVLEHQGAVGKLAFSLNEEQKLSKTNVPININSILRDIKREFASNKEIREELDRLIKGDLIAKILDLRNTAAHANTSGEYNEIEKNEVDKMIDYLRTILFIMSNIADNVAKITK